MAVGLRPYYAENTGSHPNPEVKLHQARLVLGWGTTLEPRVLQAFVFLLFCFFAFLWLVVLLQACGAVRSLRPGATACPGSTEAGTIISAIVALPLPPCPSAFLAFLTPCRARSQWRLCHQNQIHKVCAAPGRDPQGMTAVQELCECFPPST